MDASRFTNLTDLPKALQPAAATGITQWHPNGECRACGLLIGDTAPLVVTGTHTEVVVSLWPEHHRCTAGGVRVSARIMVGHTYNVLPMILPAGQGVLPVVAVNPEIDLHQVGRGNDSGDWVSLTWPQVGAPSWSPRLDSSLPATGKAVIGEQQVQLSVPPWDGAWLLHREQMRTSWDEFTRYAAAVGSLWVMVSRTHFVGDWLMLPDPMDGYEATVTSGDAWFARLPVSL